MRRKAVQNLDHVGICLCQYIQFANITYACGGNFMLT